MVNLLDDKSFLTVRSFFLECEKIAFKFNFFSRKYLVFKTGASSHDSIDGVARVAGRQGIAGFILKADTLLNAERLSG